MGKTKTKIIDDSLPVEEVKTKNPSTTHPSDGGKAAQGKAPKDALVAKLLEELGEVEAKPETSKAALKQKLDDSATKIKKKEAAISEPSRTKRGKKYQETAQLVEKTKRYPLNEAVELIQKTSYTKFPGTVEIHINTAVKNVRGLTLLPFASGKKLTILAFPSTALRTSGFIKELEESGVIIGNEDTIVEIEQGKINFDVLVTTPEWMVKLAKVAKVLGPKGLMPNPKNGTITEDLEKTIKELQSGKIEYKTEPNGQIIHLAIGKVSQPVEEISTNVKTLYQTIGKSKIKKITLAPTMGPGVKVDLNSI